MKLFKGITYPHEHISIDLSKVKNDDDCRLDCFEDTVSEFKKLAGKNVKNIIEVTNRGMGRNIDYISKVKKETGLNILCSTGYYKEPFLPEEVYELSEKELSRIMVKEIEDGIEGSSVKASVIGEIGTSKNNITNMEEKVFRASARAHVETGKAIVTHTTLGTMGDEQVKLFAEYKVDADKVVVSHVDLSNDLNYILDLVDRGVNVAFDTIGKEKYLPETERIKMLKELCRRGLSTKIVMSMDITRKSHFRSKGGVGYSYLIDNFIPSLMKAGIEKRDIDNMTVYNALRIFQ